MESINSPKSIVFPQITHVLAFQNWAKDNLPNGHSSIAISLFLFIALENSIGKPPTLKTIFMSLGYSEQGVRPHLSTFVRLGYCECIPSEIDRRVKHVVARPQMITKIRQLVEFITKFDEELHANRSAAKVAVNFE